MSSSNGASADTRPFLRIKEVDGIHTVATRHITTAIEQHLEHVRQQYRKHLEDTAQSMLSQPIPDSTRLASMREAMTLRIQTLTEELERTRAANETNDRLLDETRTELKDIRHEAERCEEEVRELRLESSRIAQETKQLSDAHPELQIEGDELRLLEELTKTASDSAGAKQPTTDELPT
ncbi:hypothetical protein FRB99_006286 [Tulasnella sp. 403]|nr:hypothetical protein FRB99_006286 [Tulasnella sp. 403]